eukprot:CAMPEP_0116885436 /NCGR_PEP_ID=MMETSP0463-20121206/18783_1 /TAXON_ID=181622 /ORGANISM="Strombidinopsis sp, Strain SopsisLIS2011" /LENGTH=50 /DNA_ID=CAMNT_0004543849 /DNA_START=114 /DNA_END=266 /DNA_ORIENTATION=+
MNKDLEKSARNVPKSFKSSNASLRASMSSQVEAENMNVRAAIIHLIGDVI